MNHVEFLTQFVKVSNDMDALRNKARALGISWQDFAEWGIESQAVVAYVTEHGYKVPLKDARVVVREYVQKQKAIAVQKLLYLLVSK